LIVFPLRYVKLLEEGKTTKPMEYNNLRDMCLALRERAGLTPPQLASKSDTSVTQVYHAEGRRDGREISAESLRQIYYDLCKNDAEYMDLLALWAINKDGNKINPKKFITKINSAKSKSETKKAGKKEELLGVFEKLNKPNQDLLMMTAESLAKKSALKALLNAWFISIKR
jgi:hypothetical protein